MSETEIKIPDGKMLKLKQENGEVKLRGDFFLEPPVALQKIEDKLENLEGVNEKSKVIDKLKEIEADFIGFSREHVADAFIEVNEKDWRIINERDFSEAMHHALDEVLLERLNKGEMKPTIRFWHRKSPAVPIGRFQSYRDEVEHGYIEDNNIEVVRRITGGGAMYAEPGDVITYSIYIPRDDVAKDIQQSYKELDEWAVEALRDLGVDVSYQPLNDIVHPDGKIGGAAQLRKEDSVLHHTMISYDLNTEKMLKALRIGKEKISDKAIESAERRVTVLNEYIDHERDEIIEKLIDNFKKKYSGEKSSYKDEELREARRLAEKKFSTRDWNKEI